VNLSFLPSRIVFNLLSMSRPRSMSRRLVLMTSTILYLKLWKERFTKYVYLQNFRPLKDVMDMRLAGMSLSMLMAYWGSTVISAPVSSLACSSNERFENGFVSLTFRDGAGGVYSWLYFMVWSARVMGSPYVFLWRLLYRCILERTRISYRLFLPVFPYPRRIL